MSTATTLEISSAQLKEECLIFAGGTSKERGTAGILNALQAELDSVDEAVSFWEEAEVLNVS